MVHKMQFSAGLDFNGVGATRDLVNERDRTEKGETGNLRYVAAEPFSEIS